MNADSFHYMPLQERIMRNNERARDPLPTSTHHKLHKTMDMQRHCTSPSESAKYGRKVLQLSLELSQERDRQDGMLLDYLPLETAVRKNGDISFSAIRSPQGGDDDKRKKMAMGGIEDSFSLMTRTELLTKSRDEMRKYGPASGFNFNFTGGGVVKAADGHDSDSDNGSSQGDPLRRNSTSNSEFDVAKSPAFAEHYNKNILNVAVYRSQSLWSPPSVYIEESISKIPIDRDKCPIVDATNAVPQGTANFGIVDVIYISSSRGEEKDLKQANTLLHAYSKWLYPLKMFSLQKDYIESNDLERVVLGITNEHDAQNNSNNRKHSVSVDGKAIVGAAAGESSNEGKEEFSKGKFKVKAILRAVMHNNSVVIRPLFTTGDVMIACRELFDAQLFVSGFVLISSALRGPYVHCNSSHYNSRLSKLTSNLINHSNNHSNNNNNSNNNSNNNKFSAPIITLSKNIHSAAPFLEGYFCCEYKLNRAPKWFFQRFNHNKSTEHLVGFLCISMHSKMPIFESIEISENCVPKNLVDMFLNLFPIVNQFYGQSSMPVTIDYYFEPCFDPQLFDELIAFLHTNVVVEADTQVGNRSFSTNSSINLWHSLDFANKIRILKKFEQFVHFRWSHASNIVFMNRLAAFRRNAISDLNGLSKSFLRNFHNKYCMKYNAIKDIYCKALVNFDQKYGGQEINSAQKFKSIGGSAGFLGVVDSEDGEDGKEAYKYALEHLKVDMQCVSSYLIRHSGVLNGGTHKGRRGALQKGLKRVDIEELSVIVEEDVFSDHSSDSECNYDSEGNEVHYTNNYFAEDKYKSKSKSKAEEINDSIFSDPDPDPDDSFFLDKSIRQFMKSRHTEPDKKRVEFKTSSSGDKSEVNLDDVVYKVPFECPYVDVNELKARYDANELYYQNYAALLNKNKKRPQTQVNNSLFGARRSMMGVKPKPSVAISGVDGTSKELSTPARERAPSSDLGGVGMRDRAPSSDLGGDPSAAQVRRHAKDLLEIEKGGAEESKDSAPNEKYKKIHAAAVASKTKDLSSSSSMQDVDPKQKHLVISGISSIAVVQKVVSDENSAPQPASRESKERPIIQQLQTLSQIPNNIVLDAGVASMISKTSYNECVLEPDDSLENILKVNKVSEHRIGSINKNKDDNNSNDNEIVGIIGERTRVQAMTSSELLTPPTGSTGSTINSINSNAKNASRPSSKSESRGQSNPVSRDESRPAANPPSGPSSRVTSRLTSRENDVGDRGSNPAAVSVSMSISVSIPSIHLTSSNGGSGVNSPAGSRPGSSSKVNGGRTGISGQARAEAREGGASQVVDAAAATDGARVAVALLAISTPTTAAKSTINLLTDAADTAVSADLDGGPIDPKLCMPSSANTSVLVPVSQSENKLTSEAVKSTDTDIRVGHNSGYNNSNSKNPGAVPVKRLYSINSIGNNATSIGNFSRITDSLTTPNESIFEGNSVYSEMVSLDVETLKHHEQPAPHVFGWLKVISNIMSYAFIDVPLPPHPTNPASIPADADELYVVGNVHFYLDGLCLDFLFVRLCLDILEFSEQDLIENMSSGSYQFIIFLLNRFKVKYSFDFLEMLKVLLSSDCSSEDVRSSSELFLTPRQVSSLSIGSKESLPHKWSKEEILPLVAALKGQNITKQDLGNCLHKIVLTMGNSNASSRPVEEGPVFLNVDEESMLYGDFNIRNRIIQLVKLFLGRYNHKEFRVHIDELVARVADHSFIEYIKFELPFLKSFESSSTIDTIELSSKKKRGASRDPPKIQIPENKIRSTVLRSLSRDEILIYTPGTSPFKMNVYFKDSDTKHTTEDLQYMKSLYEDQKLMSLSTIIDLNNEFIKSLSSEIGRTSAIGDRERDRDSMSGGRGSTCTGSRDGRSGNSSQKPRTRGDSKATRRQRAATTDPDLNSYTNVPQNKNRHLDSFSKSSAGLGRHDRSSSLSFSSLQSLQGGELWGDDVGEIVPLCWSDVGASVNLDKLQKSQKAGHYFYDESELSIENIFSDDRFKNLIENVNETIGKNNPLRRRIEGIIHSFATNYARGLLECTVEKLAHGVSQIMTVRRKQKLEQDFSQRVKKKNQMTLMKQQQEEQATREKKVKLGIFSQSGTAKSYPIPVVAATTTTTATAPIIDDVRVSAGAKKGSSRPISNNLRITNGYSNNNVVVSKTLSYLDADDQRNENKDLNLDIYLNPSQTDHRNMSNINTMAAAYSRLDYYVSEHDTKRNTNLTSNDRDSDGEADVAIKMPYITISHSSSRSSRAEMSDLFVMDDSVIYDDEGGSCVDPIIANTMACSSLNPNPIQPNQKRGVTANPAKTSRLPIFDNASSRNTALELYVGSLNVLGYGTSFNSQPNFPKERIANSPAAFRPKFQKIPASSPSPLLTSPNSSSPRGVSGRSMKTIQQSKYSKNSPPPPTKSSAFFPSPTVTNSNDSNFKPADLVPDTNIQQQHGNNPGQNSSQATVASSSGAIHAAPQPPTSPPAQLSQLALDDAGQHNNATGNIPGNVPANVPASENEPVPPGIASGAAGLRKQFVRKQYTFKDHKVNKTNPFPIPGIETKPPPKPLPVPGTTSPCRISPFNINKTRLTHVDLGGSLDHRPVSANVDPVDDSFAPMDINTPNFYPKTPTSAQQRRKVIRKDNEVLGSETEAISTVIHNNNNTNNNSSGCSSENQPMKIVIRLKSPDPVAEHPQATQESFDAMTAFASGSFLSGLPVLSQSGLVASMFSSRPTSSMDKERDALAAARANSPRDHMERIGSPLNGVVDFTKANGKPGSGSNGFRGVSPAGRVRELYDKGVVDSNQDLRHYLNPEIGFRNSALSNIVYDLEAHQDYTAVFSNINNPLILKRVEPVSSRNKVMMNKHYKALSPPSSPINGSTRDNLNNFKSSFPSREYVCEGLVGGEVGVGNNSSHIIADEGENTRPVAVIPLQLPVRFSNERKDASPSSKGSVKFLATGGGPIDGPMSHNHHGDLVGGVVDGFVAQCDNDVGMNGDVAVVFADKSIISITDSII